MAVRRNSNFCLTHH